MILIRHGTHHIRIQKSCEAAGNTNAELVDTDGDGVSDGDEVKVQFTDPLDATNLRKLIINQSAISNLLVTTLLEIP